MIALQQEKWTYDAEKNLLIPAKEERRMIFLIHIYFRGN